MENKARCISNPGYYFVDTDEEDTCFSQVNYYIVTDGTCGIDYYSACALHMMPFKFKKGHWSHWSNWMVWDESFEPTEEQMDDGAWDHWRPLSEQEFWYRVGAEARS